MHSPEAHSMKEKKMMSLIIFNLTMSLIISAPAMKLPPTTQEIFKSRCESTIEAALNKQREKEAPENIGEVEELLKTQEAIEILTRITEAEATGGTLEQKINVASCVLARALSDEWPDTIEGVVFQKKQFSPIYDGRYYTVSITQSSKDAVEYVKEHGPAHKCIFFCSYDCTSKYFEKKGKPTFKDGIHRYYER